ncbi:MAG: hypothetical protein JKY88_15235 [Pseudomonadales bacterium]|nr:hypothetical protein [Pseudomonadales bacterium]
MCLVLLDRSVFANELDYPDAIYRTVDFVVLDQDSPPGATAAWKSISLPYHSNLEKNRSFNKVSVHWIRLSLSKVPIRSDMPQVVYIWRHNIRLKVFLGQDLIGGTSTNMLGRDTISWNTPLLIDLPRQLDSYLYFRVESGPSGALLSPVMLGEREILLPLYETRYFWQVEAAKWSFGLGLVLGFLSLWIWSNRRQDSLYWQFAAMSVSASLSFLFMFIEFIPFDLRFWLTIIHSAMDWGNYFLVLFTLNALDLRMLIFRNGMFAIAVFATLSHLFVPDTHFFELAYFFLWLETLGIVILVAIIFWQTLRYGGATRKWFTATFSGVIALVLRIFI